MPRGKATTSTSGEDVVNTIMRVSAAQQALDAATSLTEMKEVRDFAKTLQAGAKARGMGVDSENLAAEVVYRAERLMGGELIRMAETGERAPQSNPGEFRGNAAVESRRSTLPTLADMGIDKHESSLWQMLARVPDEDFERTLRDLLAAKKRIARIDFYKIAQAIVGKPRKEKKETEALTTEANDAWTEDWNTFIAAAQSLGAHAERGWPVQADRTPRGWRALKDEVKAISPNLNLFLSRVRGFNSEEAE